MTPAAKIVFQTCDTPGCRGISKLPLCPVCRDLITRKETRRFRAAIGGQNKLRYYQTILLPAIARRHEQRGAN
jgi:hypothetical protein